MAQITEYRRQRIRRELEMTKERLELYLAREKEMLSKDGVQLYTIGSRNLQRYNTSLAAIQAEIDKLRKRVDELEAELAGAGEILERLEARNAGRSRLYYGRHGRGTLLPRPACRFLCTRQGGEKNQVRKKGGNVAPRQRKTTEQRLRRSRGQLAQEGCERLQRSQRLTSRGHRL